MRIFLIGFMGSGKSHTGKELAQLLQYPFIDLDDWIEEKAQKTISAVFAENGEKYFRELERTALEEMIQFENAIIACGGGTPCFHGNIEWMNNNGLTIYLETKDDILLTRLEPEKKHRPLLQKYDKVQLKLFIQEKIKERSKYYNQAWVIYKQESLNEKVAIRLVKELSNIIGH